MTRIALHSKLGVILTTSTEEVPTCDVYHYPRLIAGSDFHFLGMLHADSPVDYLCKILKEGNFSAIDPSDIPGWDILDGKKWRKKRVPGAYEHFFKAPVFHEQTMIKGAGATYKGTKDIRDVRQHLAEPGASVTPSDYVYQAPIPEIFQKAVGSENFKIVGPGQAIGLCNDSEYMSVEGEIGYLVNSCGKIIGDFIANDITDYHRLAESPLYLPEAKSFERCVSIGPWIRIYDEPIRITDEKSPIPADTRVTLRNFDLRDGSIYEEVTYQYGEIQRTPQELIYWAMCNQRCIGGLMLLCGAGHPRSKPVDENNIVQVHCEGLGTLVNPTIRLDNGIEKPRCVQDRNFKVVN